MEIDRERIEEFIWLWAEEFGDELSEAEASARALQLLNLYTSLLGLDVPIGKSPGDH